MDVSTTATTTTAKPETRIARLKRISSSFLGRRGPASATTDRQLPELSDESSSSTQSLSDTNSSITNKFIGQHPFSILVGGEPGVGKSKLVDRVFGVACASNPSLVKDQASSGDQVTSVESIPATPTTSPKRKPVDFVKVARFESPEDISSLSQHDLSILRLDIAWYLVVGRFTPADIAACKRIVSVGVPLLVLLSKADLASPEDLDVIENDVRTEMAAYSPKNWDIARVSNPPAPVCSDCCAVALLKPIPTTGFNGWFCTNDKCDLFGPNAFKVNQQPMSTYTQKLVPLVQKTKRLLLHCSVSSAATTAALSSVAEDAKRLSIEGVTAATSSGNVLANRRFQIAQLVDTHAKFEYAKVFVITSTLLAAGFGANPIPFIDAPLLVATQFTLVTSICSVYGIPNTSTYYGLFKYVMAAPLLGLMGADMLKLIPGVGTVVGGVVDVVICATLTLSLGIAVVKMCDNLITERNAKAYGVGVGRPEFQLNNQVGMVFKEVYTSSKEAIKGMLNTGTLSKEGLMQMMQTNVSVEEEVVAFAGSVSEEDVAEKDEKEIEELAYEMLLAQQNEKKSQGS